ncbi:MAG TPA: DNA-3-methyladenine glycosylase [Patescibacteria group bacterium]|jgi:DNA-3-methyladenine glycosylase II|nr:DNA-3-methyladenine glycosylase [Patescibacteria group bacterium]
MKPEKNKLLSPAAKYLSKVDPILGAAIEQIELEENRKPNKNHLRSLVESIVSQQLSVKAADTIFARFVELFVAKGDIKTARSFPTPAQLLNMSDAKLRSAGLSGGKVKYIKDLARKVEAKELQLHRLQKMSDEEVVEHLVQVKGIGRWTGEMFLMFSLARPDIFSHGDLGLRNAIIKLYKFKTIPTEKQIQKIVAKWSPHRTLASRYLWKSLNNE